MKILHVITSLQTGGAEKLMVDLLPRFKEKGADVELAIFDGRITPFYNQLTSQGIKIHRFLPNGGSVYALSNLIKLIRLIYKEKYDIIHTHNTSPQLYAAIASYFSNFKLVTTEHSTDNRRRNKSWFKPIDKWMYSRYDKVICIADKAQSTLENYLGANCRNITINNGVDLSKYINPIKSILDKDDLILVMVAGLRHEKDQDTIIKSLQLLPNNFKLRLIGDGVRKEELGKLCEELGVKDRVEFMGVRSDIPEQLKDADIVIMSSHYEGLSLSSVEGMASGRPFIASDVDGLGEVVNGAGLLFPHQDAKALADTILTLTSDNDYYQKIAAQCQQRAKQYDIENMVNEYYSLYLSL